MCRGVYLPRFEYSSIPWRPSWDSLNRDHQRGLSSRRGSSRSVCCRSHLPYVRGVDGQGAGGVADVGGAQGVVRGVARGVVRGVARADDVVGVVDDRECLAVLAPREYSKVQVQKQ